MDMIFSDFRPSFYLKTMTYPRLLKHYSKNLNKELSLEEVIEHYIKEGVLFETGFISFEGKMNLTLEGVVKSEISKRGMSENQFCDLFKVPRNQISLLSKLKPNKRKMIKNGAYKHSLNTYVNLSRVIRVDIEELKDLPINPIEFIHDFMVSYEIPLKYKEEVCLIFSKIYGYDYLSQYLKCLERLIDDQKKS